MDKDEDLCVYVVDKATLDDKATFDDTITDSEEQVNTKSKPARTNPITWKNIAKVLGGSTLTTGVYLGILKLVKDAEFAGIKFGELFNNEQAFYSAATIFVGTTAVITYNTWKSKPTSATATEQLQSYTPASDDTQKQL